MLTMMLTASTPRAKQQNERRKHLRRHVSEQGEAPGVCAAVANNSQGFPHNEP